MYAAAVPYGSGHVLVFGGDDGRELQHRAALERAIGGAATSQEADSLRGQLREAFMGHEGFSKELLAYHAITNTWVSLGEAQTGFPAVSTAVIAGGGIVIPSWARYVPACVRRRTDRDDSRAGGVRLGQLFRNYCLSAGYDGYRRLFRPQEQYD